MQHWEEVWRKRQPEEDGCSRKTRCERGRIPASEGFGEVNREEDPREAYDGEEVSTEGKQLYKKI